MVPTGSLSLCISVSLALFYIMLTRELILSQSKRHHALLLDGNARHVSSRNISLLFSARGRANTAVACGEQHAAEITLPGDLRSKNLRAASVMGTWFSIASREDVNGQEGSWWMGVLCVLCDDAVVACWCQSIFNFQFSIS